VKKNKLISIVFIISGIYDGVLGLAFLIYPQFGFDFFNVGYPNHWGYVRFPAAILVVFAIMFFAIAFRPEKNRNLIPYGVLLKLSYSLIVFGYWFTKGLPNMWKPFAIADMGFIVLFLWSYFTLGKQQDRE
jgi:hypothetical protein